MVRDAFPSMEALATAALAVVWCVVATAAAVRPQEAEPAGMAAVADAVLWGRALPPPARTADLPAGIQSRLAEYRRREAAFKSGLTPPPGATPEEARVFEQRVGIERVVFSLFDRRDGARIAATYALDADLGFREAQFIDGLLRHLRQPWLAPYLNLVAGGLKVCAGELAEGRRQLIAARDGGHPLIRLVAEDLLIRKQCAGDGPP